MISAFQSCEFRFGLKMSREQLEQVNKFHEGTKYADEEAAKARKGSPYKSALTSSPFVIKFSYSVSEQGYWKSAHMVIQLEDCIDCLTVNTTFCSYLITHVVMKSKEDELNVKDVKRVWR